MEPETQAQTEPAVPAIEVAVEAAPEATPEVVVEPAPVEEVTNG